MANFTTYLGLNQVPQQAFYNLLSSKSALYRYFSNNILYLFPFYIFFPKRTLCNSGNIYQKWPIIDPDGHSQEILTGNSAAAVRGGGPRGT